MNHFNGECTDIKNLENLENFILEIYFKDIKTSHFKTISSQKLNSRISLETIMPMIKSLAI